MNKKTKVLWKVYIVYDYLSSRVGKTIWVSTTKISINDGIKGAEKILHKSHIYPNWNIVSIERMGEILS